MISGHADTTEEPERDCALCPRLREFTLENRQLYPDYHNAPVPDGKPSSGVSLASLLIVGLAPGLRGANRTGVPFNGDHAGEMLMQRLMQHGFVHIDDQGKIDFKNCVVTNAVRCVPPQNKPLPAEINTCRSYLKTRIAGMSNLSTILAIGRIAHDSVVRSFGRSLREHPFTHGNSLEFGGITLISSYHCSRYNFNTGVLTDEMLDSVFQKIADLARDPVKTSGFDKSLNVVLT